jgi:hypothetical protein
MRGAPLSPDANHPAGLFGHSGCAEDALMREVVGFIQLACALTLGMAGGWAVHQTDLVMGGSGFCFFI